MRKIAREVANRLERLTTWEVLNVVYALETRLAQWQADRVDETAIQHLGELIAKIRQSNVYLDQGLMPSVKPLFTTNRYSVTVTARGLVIHRITDDMRVVIYPPESAMVLRDLEFCHGRGFSMEKYIDEHMLAEGGWVIDAV